jgi:hypothetical protein
LQAAQVELFAREMTPITGSISVLGYFPPVETFGHWQSIREGMRSLELQVAAYFAAYNRQ